MIKVEFQFSRNRNRLFDLLTMIFDFFIQATMLKKTKMKRRNTEPSLVSVDEASEA